MPLPDNYLASANITWEVQESATGGAAPIFHFCNFLACKDSVFTMSNEFVIAEA